MTEIARLPDLHPPTEPVGEDGRLAELEARLRATEKLLQHSTAKLRMALEIGKLGSFEWDMLTDEIVMEPSARDTCGYTANQPISCPEFQELFHPHDRNRVEQAMAYAQQTRTDFNTQSRIVRADGKTRLILLRGHMVYDETGRPVRVVAIIQDVTEQERTRQEGTLAQRRQTFLLNLNDQRAGSRRPQHDHGGDGQGPRPVPGGRFRRLRRSRRGTRRQRHLAGMVAVGGEQRGAPVSPQRFPAQHDHRVEEGPGPVGRRCGDRSPDERSRVSRDLQDHQCAKRACRAVAEEPAARGAALSQHGTPAQMVDGRTDARAGRRRAHLDGGSESPRRDRPA